MAAVSQTMGVSPAPSGTPAPAWLDGRPRVGIHTSIAGDPSNALEIAARIGCTALQIFSASPRMWPRPHQRRIPPEVAQRFRERRAALRLGPLAVHANYLINLAAPDPRQWQNSVEAFADEIIRAAQLGAEYLIVHPGSPRDSGIDRGIASVAEAVACACSSSASDIGPSAVRVLFENTAGQGTGLASEFDHLRRLLDGCRSRWDRLSACPDEGRACPLPGICLDTAHLLAAGFEIRTPEGLHRTLAEAGAAFGLETVCVIHCNDSKSPLGSRRDRHEHIGRGEIGRQAFARILNHPLLRSPQRAFLAETPIDRPGDDRRNVRALWSLLGLKPPAAAGKPLAPTARSPLSATGAVRLSPSPRSSRAAASLLVSPKSSRGKRQGAVPPDPSVGIKLRPSRPRRRTHRISSSRSRR